MNNVILTITGPSASGKSTLEAMLCDPKGSIFSKVVSHTTRTPRKGEVNGKDYHFVLKEYFDFMVRNNEFAEVVNFGGNSYGAHQTEFKSIFSKQQIAVVVVEPHGKDAVEAFARLCGHSYLSVFLTNPASIRYKRLLNRFIKDIEHLELGGGDMNAQLAKFAERLAVTSEVESQWVRDAGHYDIAVETFGEGNSAAVVNQISAFALNALTVLKVSPGSRGAARQL